MQTGIFRKFPVIIKNRSNYKIVIFRGKIRDCLFTGINQYCRIGIFFLKRTGNITHRIAVHIDERMKFTRQIMVIRRQLTS